MVAQLTMTGMILTVMPIGDYDKRLVILTKERGKINAFAKGARKQNSTLLACCQPFTFGSFSLYEGKSSYNVVSADISNYFVELREDLETVSYGLYFCELADYFTRENVNETFVLKLLYQSLRALAKRSISQELIRYIFELKIITLNGEAPQMFECVKCGKEEETYFFSPLSGGLLCTLCKENEKTIIGKDAIFIGGSTIYTMQYIITSSIEKLYTFKVSAEVMKELKISMKRYMGVYVEKDFKSLEMMESFVF